MYKHKYTNTPYDLKEPEIVGGGSSGTTVDLSDINASIASLNTFRDDITDATTKASATASQAITNAQVVYNATKVLEARETALTKRVALNEVKHDYSLYEYIVANPTYRDNAFVAIPTTRTYTFAVPKAGNYVVIIELDASDADTPQYLRNFVAYGANNTTVYMREVKGLYKMVVFARTTGATLDITMGNRSSTNSKPTNFTGRLLVGAIKNSNEYLVAKDVLLSEAGNAYVKPSVLSLGLDSGHITYTVDTSSLDQSTNYPLILSYVPVFDITTIVVTANLDTWGQGVTWSTHGSGGISLYYRWTTNGSGWGTTSVTRTDVQKKLSWANHTQPSAGQLTNNSDEYLLLRGGPIYRVTVPITIGAPQLVTPATPYIGRSQTIEPSAV